MVWCRQPFVRLGHIWSYAYCCWFVVFFITDNPFVNSSGYHLAAAFIDASDFRKQAYLAFINKIRGNVFKEAENNLLIAYLFVSGIFMVLCIAFFMFLLNCYLDYHIGGISVVIVSVLFGWMAWNVYVKCKELDEDYRLKIQFERWRERTLSNVESGQGVARDDSDSPFW
jgi:putative peptide zinc metalloprotease protein